jgi:BarA-like signal transduction histidine kinase
MSTSSSTACAKTTLADKACDQGQRQCFRDPLSSSCQKRLLPAALLEVMNIQSDMSQAVLYIHNEA